VRRAKTRKAKRAAPKLSHVARDGTVRMVDVGAKPVTQRVAVAQAEVSMRPEALALVRRGAAKKGNVLVTAQIAGILAAKRTAQIIPLCHPLSLTHLDVHCRIVGDDRIVVRCTVACSGQTGVEMEALTGAAVAALTIYDMCKSADRAMKIERVMLLEKAGGKSGSFKRGRRG
jgi:cyclic pyranopterin monophosphate synthase